MSSIMSNVVSHNSSTAVAQSLLPHASTMTAGVAATKAATPVDNSTITSSDFLTLLVTEMKNQDPTQPTDPSSYIQQLVGVNSLQQLISINSGIDALNPTVSSSALSTPSSVAPVSGTSASAVSSAAVTSGVSSSTDNL
jgi:flagellar basal-body rod modification protein FlgD